jgi:hypothetical protein
MALIDTQTFPLTRQRLEAAVRIIPNNPDIFSGNRMREARVEFISGKNVLSSIKGWLVAAEIAERKGNSYQLTEFGRRVVDNDRKIARAGSWWAVHLTICFSTRCEPYRTFFAVLGDRGGWHVVDQKFAELISPLVAESSGGAVAPVTIVGNLDGVKKMFLGESPLTDLGLIETRKEAGKQLFRLGTPEVADETLVYALALARQRHFRSAATINFSELTGIDFHHFLGMSVSKLQRRLREISRNRKWAEHFKFVEGKDLESIEPRSSLWPRLAVLPLLQETTDTWL